MTLSKTALIAAAFISLLSSCQTNDKQGETKIEKKIDSVFATYNDLKKPGAAVAVVKDGNVVFKKGYGSANLEYDIPVTPATIFHIASVSKQFTAFAILLLADEGKLSFDDDVRKYIPEVPDFGKTITLRHLAAHTSGLRDQWNLLAMAGWRLDDVITKEHVLKLVSKQKELNFQPGEEYVYCNTGFTLLAEVVARVSGKSFGEFTRARIFEPLQMTNTLFYEDHERIVRNRAYSYYQDSTGYKKSVLSYANAGATSLFTTVEDISLWAMNFEEPKVGSKKVFDEMNSLAKLNNGKTFGGAYGQFFDKYKGLNMVSHSGGDAGYRTFLARFPDEHFAVAVFSNLGESDPGDLALKVADIYLRDKEVEEPEKQKEKPAFIRLSKEASEKFAGDYWNEGESYARKIYWKDDTLRYSRGGSNESPLVPIAENVFQMLNVEADLKVRFETKGGQKNMWVTINDGEPSLFEGFIPENYSKSDFEKLTGVFYSNELSTAYTFVVKGDQLVATHPRHNDITLSPVKKDVFSGSEWFFSTIKYERNAAGQVSGIRVSSGRVRGLYFRKQ